MTEKKPRATSAVFELYAAGLARDTALPSGSKTAAGEGMSELVEHGAKGWPEHGTLYTRSLPPGCAQCLKGQGSNLCLTTLCTRECFFCFNPKPRAEGLSVHGKAVSDESEIAGILAEHDVASVGLSGGEPLLDPERTLRIVRLLRQRFGKGLRLDLYTNGDLFTEELLGRLREAGVNGLRINLVANGYDLTPVKMALGKIKDVTVEIPAIPGHRESLKRLVRELDEAGAGHLILHELFASAQNIDALIKRGCEAAPGEYDKLTWSGVAESGELALEIMRYAQDNAKKLSVYYCSCATQQWIAENALNRARPGP